jgi:hypothetical protein
MQRQNISKNTKASLLKRLRFSFLIPVIMIFWSAILGSTSASAQKLTAENIACNVSAQARYECYIKVKKDSQAIADSRLSTLDSQKKIRQEAYFKFKERMGSLENAKAIAITRKSILEEQEKLRLELNESPKKQRKKINRQEIMQQVEYSRSRNISHKGEKYSITYGYVLEPRP